MLRFLSALFLALTVATAAQSASYFPPLDPPSYKEAHITTATTNAAIVTGPGTLRRICVNTPIAAGTVTADDALTATAPVLAVVTTPSAAGNPFCQSFDYSFFTGLTVVTVGAQDVNVIYQN